MALPLWNSKTAHTTPLCLHPNGGVSLGICGSKIGFQQCLVLFVVEREEESKKMMTGMSGLSFLGPKMAVS